MLANRIHSQLHAVGLSLPREQLLRQATRTWLRETAGPVLRPEQRRLIQSPWLLVGYAGLAPITRTSADKVHHGPLPNAANRWVRGALISTIPTHLRCAPTSGLSQYYARQKARLGWQIARVATARQLARVIYHMLRTGEVWRETPAPVGRS
jgi:hypothetical protein